MLLYSCLDKYLSLENNKGQGNWPRATLIRSISLIKHINLNYLLEYLIIAFENFMSRISQIQDSASLKSV